MTQKYRILLLASGAGTLAQSIIDATIEKRIDLDIVGLVSDQKSLALTRAKRSNIPNFYIPLTGPRQAWDDKLILQVSELKPDLVVSVGFMRILSDSFLLKFKAINSHPSLLPNFPGANAVADCLAAGATRSGCTIHWIDEGIDTGKIIAQQEVEILKTDSQDSLHERIKIQERRLIVEVLQKLIDSY
jgi:phosphoribosylglycinamide formyltransferase-1